jgi:Recombinase.
MFSNSIKTKLGSDWTKKKIQLILRNPLYVKSTKKVLDYLTNLGMNVSGEPNGNGILTYNKSKNIKIKRDISEWIAAVSNHKGIINSNKWLEVQSILDNNKHKAPRMSTSSVSLLTGLIKCSKCKSNMLVKHGHISNITRKRYLYYVCSTKDNSNGTRCNSKNIRVDEVEEAIINKFNNLNMSNLLLFLKAHKKDSSNYNTLYN